MSTIPAPFFCTRGAVLYTERVRLEKETYKKEFENDSIPVKDGKHLKRVSCFNRKYSKIISN